MAVKDNFQADSLTINIDEVHGMLELHAHNQQRIYAAQGADCIQKIRYIHCHAQIQFWARIWSK
jgi:hypothetical protein